MNEGDAKRRNMFVSGIMKGKEHVETWVQMGGQYLNDLAETRC
jgi:hypothetical protein